MKLMLNEKQVAIITNALTHHVHELRAAAAREADGSRMHAAFTRDAEQADVLLTQIEVAS